MDCEPTSASSITSYLRSSENENADSPAGHYSDFPAPHAYRGCRAEIRYRAGVPVRNRLEGGAEQCVTRERQAREKLQTEWKQFTPSQKNICKREVGGDGRD